MAFQATSEGLCDKAGKYMLLVAAFLLIIPQCATAEEPTHKSTVSAKKSAKVLLRGHVRTANPELTKFGIDCEHTDDKEWPLRVVEAKVTSKTGIRKGDLLKEPTRSIEGTTVLINRAGKTYRSLLEKAPPGSEFSSLPVVLAGRSWVSWDDRTGCEVLEDEVYKNKLLGDRWRRWAEPIMRAASKRCGSKTSLYSQGVTFRVNYDQQKILIFANFLPKEELQSVYRDIAGMLLNRPAGSKVRDVFIQLYFSGGAVIKIPRPENDSGHAYVGHINYDLPRPDPFSRIGDTGIPYCISKGRRLCFGSVEIARLPGTLKDFSKK